MPPPTPTLPAAAGHVRGTSEYRRVVAGAWAAGVGSFTLLYAPQALLPQLSDAFSVSASTSALAVSVATGALAVALLPLTAVADRWGRTRVMTLSLAAAAALGLLVPLSPTFEVLLVLRALQGLAVAGVPALLMAHLSDEVSGRSLGSAMGLFVAGNTLGGLSGRLISSAVADVAGWRAGLVAVGALGVACAVVFRLLLPPPAVRPARSAESPAEQVLVHLRDSGMRRLCATAFVLMAAFVTVYNYLPYRLLAAPFSLSPTLVGLTFATYLAGTGTATFAGRLGDRFGRSRVLSGSVVLALAAAALTLAPSLLLVLAGLTLFTVGFFGAHTAASGWVGRRALTGRAQASAMYLFSYYAGSSVGGWVGGFPFERAGWPAVVGYVALLLVGALGLALLLRRTPRLAAPA